MSDPWVLLITTAIPSVIVAIIAHRAPNRQAESQANVTEASRLDAKVRDFLDRTLGDNARLRVENAEYATSVSHFMTLARRWCDMAHELRHGRNNDRMVAEAHLGRAGAAAIDWPPNPPLPGFEEID